MSLMLSTAAEFVLAQAPTIPNPPPGVPKEFQGFGDMIVAALKWVLIVAGVAGLLACAIMIVIGRRNRNQLAQQGIFDVGYVMLGLAVGSVAAVVVGMFAI